MVVDGLSSVYRWEAFGSLTLDSLAVGVGSNVESCLRPTVDIRGVLGIFGIFNTTFDASVFKDSRDEACGILTGRTWLFPQVNFPTTGLLNARRGILGFQRVYVILLQI